MKSDRDFSEQQCIMHSYEQDITSVQTNTTLEIIMWTTPAATEMRFGFEVTMYVMNK
jgi:pyrroloquinoline quinone biosynthesis protein A